ncbi:MAG: oligopeptide transporter permease protein [Chloroflexi bacterium]|jgi:oligopeptide transport system permease protein|nr:oligopeptide transporter permease protein [Chloroflexota bacterium]
MAKVSKERISGPGSSRGGNILPSKGKKPAAETFPRATNSLWRDAWRRLRRNKLAMLGLLAVSGLVLIAIFAPWIARYQPDQPFYDSSSPKPYNEQNFQPPSAAHWMGTTGQNYDLWARIVYGSRISLSVGFVVQAIVLFIGVPLGLLAGYFGGWIDNLIMRLTDIFRAFPYLLLALLFLSSFGSSILWVYVAIAISTWPLMARLVRGQILGLKNKEFIEAAHATGASTFRILWKHILPNTLGPIIVAVSYGIPEAIITEAFLGFIGVSGDPAAPSWGRLISEGRDAFQSNPPTILIFPCLMVVITVMALNFLGDGLRDALDPRQGQGSGKK